MFLVMGITGKVGGATARHLLAQGKMVRALVRDRAKAASWTEQGVELVDGDWNDAAAIERALKGVDGAFVMLPAVWAPSPDFKEAKGGTLPVYYNPTDRKSTMVATNDIGAEVATLLAGPAWSGSRIVELGSMVSADEVAAQLGDVMQLDVKEIGRAHV